MPSLNASIKNMSTNLMRKNIVRLNIIILLVKFLHIRQFLKVYNYPVMFFLLIHDVQSKITKDSRGAYDPYYLAYIN